MGVLAPLFLGGLAALSLPLIFHLVRRTPRGRQEFSSLMFLSPSPPRLTRRSRLDQILLLLLRIAAITLLALAFARPFLREAALLTESALPRRRVAILIDNSASMRRGDLWQQAIKTAERELDQLAPHDNVALFAFTDHVQTLVPFSREGDAVQDSAVDVVRQQLHQLQPTWLASNLGLALTTLASELDAASDVQQSLAEPQIVVISDFQKGSRIDALTGFDWPEKTGIVPKALQLKATTNAHVQLLTNRDETEDAELRVRVANASDSQGDQFFVRWASEKRQPTDGEIAIYVPPGQSRVLRLPRPESNLLADRIILRGDDHDFDNTFFVVPPRKQEVTLAYLGNDQADDPQGLQYYLQLACSGDPLRQVTTQSAASGDYAATQIVVVTRKLTDGEQSTLAKYAERGGTLLLAPSDQAAASALPLLLDDVELNEPKPVREGDFTLLGEIDFVHPLFAPFASPRYNDFTKVHFWQHRSISLKAGSPTRVVARLDDGDPWLLERITGQGRILAMTSCWSPDDSQLALSSKFVPLIGNLLDLACGSTKPLEGVTVGESVTSAAKPYESVEGRMDLRSVRQRRTEGPSYDAPGIVRDGDTAVAVNLAASESDTAPMQLEQLEQLGVRQATALTRAERLSRIRQQRDTELESRQKVWRWLLVGCLLLLIGETLWAGRAASPATSTSTAKEAMA
jgi:hypothetical protein